MKLEATARCPYCGKLNTYSLKPNTEVLATCTCRKGTFYVKRVDRIEIRSGDGSDGRMVVDGRGA